MWFIVNTEKFTRKDLELVIKITLIW